MDILDDPQRCQNTYFTKATTSLVITKPQTLTKVRHQGATYTCTSHVATATMHGDEVARKGHSMLGSAQEYLDYLHQYVRPNLVAAKGPFEVPPSGFPFSYKKVFYYARDHGVSPVDIYRWKGRCKFRYCSGKKWDEVVKYKNKLIEKEQKIWIKGYKRVELDNIEEMLLHQPITGCVKLTDKFQSWTGDRIFRGEGRRLDEGLHAVTIVGYGHEDGDDYFLCQNSYGLDWGYMGYVKVRRDMITHTFIPIGTRSPGEDDEIEDVAPEEVGGKEDNEIEDVAPEEVGGEEDMGHHDKKRRIDD